MKHLFDTTYELLMFLSRITGFSYKEINFIIWFIIIPLSWAFLIDNIRGNHVFKIICISIIIIFSFAVSDFSVFANNVFDKSADFLRSFDFIGSDYTTSSVVICLFIPLIVYMALIKKAYFRRESI